MSFVDPSAYRCLTMREFMPDPKQPPSSASKSEWRTWAERIDRSAYSRAVVGNLKEWPPIHGVVVAYLAMSSEIDLSELFSLERCRIALPRVETPTTMSIRYLDPDHLESHRLGFRQPAASSKEVAMEDIDIVLVPGLVFDRTGGRLGRGRGYYDRFLSEVPMCATRIGVTSGASLVEQVPMDDHDQYVDWLATEVGVIRAGGDLPDETERVMSAAIAAGIAPRIHRFPEGTRTSKDAARAVGCELGAIAKSLVFEVDGRPVLALCSGDRRVDEQRLAAVFGGRGARPASRDRVLEITGFPAGGTPAFGHAHELEVVADVSLARYRCVWTAGGTTDTVYPVSIDRLIAASRAQWEEIASRG
jgi:5,10-methenyltetrahydrofolate synthetase